MIDYSQLWQILDERFMLPYDLITNKVVAGQTFSRLRKNRNINTSSVNDICRFLQIQPGDFMRYIPDEGEDEEESEEK